ncbi:hypothetical protein C5167_013681 [Papaver somniferum]|uniref:Secreted protein n=1 Tax=Papaver somniferum TaxID=3469 RepID=A0A4Y7J453_PAPSO|nr:hypothetical protein C5167_013681 [Papaver somniferum]
MHGLFRFTWEFRQVLVLKFFGCFRATAQCSKKIKQCSGVLWRTQSLAGKPAGMFYLLGLKVVVRKELCKSPYALSLLQHITNYPLHNTHVSLLLEM